MQRLGLTLGTTEDKENFSLGGQGSTSPKFLQIGIFEPPVEPNKVGLELELLILM